MKIYIKNELDNNVFINLINKERTLVSSFLIVSDELEIDNSEIEYCSFSFGDINSELIRLSNNIEGLRIYYNKNIKHIDVDLFRINEKYGSVETYILKDEKNLFFREVKEKNIHVLLPYDYSKNKKYGLLLMLDGQNIFDINKVGKYTTKNDPYGGWQIETSINNEYIVVGIENADKYRETELTPSTREVIFKDILYSIDEKGLLEGELDSFRRFINETLFPFILDKYNIDESNIGICGSSCGGLASFYLGLKDINKYKFIFSFTPATGFIKDESLNKIYEKIDFDKNQNLLPYLFYYQGNKGDLEKLLFEVNKDLIGNLILNGYTEDLIEQYIEESAEHNEIMWRYGFNYAFSKYLEFKEKKYGSK